MTGKKYSADFKINAVKEYEDQKGTLSIAEFARSKGIADSTFNDWVIKFRNLGNGFCNVTEQIAIISANSNEDSTVIKEYTAIEGVSGLDKMPDGFARVTYNGAVIEFRDSLLDKVMEIIRQW